LVGGGGRTQDYLEIDRVLSEAGAQRPLFTLWIYEGNLYENTESIRNVLLPYFRETDRLLVVEAKDYAWYIGIPV
jgi:hypothetical protein